MIQYKTFSMVTQKPFPKTGPTFNETFPNLLTSFLEQQSRYNVQQGVQIVEHVEKNVEQIVKIMNIVKIVGKSSTPLKLIIY